MQTTTETRSDLEPWDVLYDAYLDGHKPISPQGWLMLDAAAHIAKSAESLTPAEHARTEGMYPVLVGLAGAIFEWEHLMDGSE